MTKDELIKEIHKIDNKVQNQYAKDIESSPYYSDKTFNYIEETAIKAHDNFEWVIRMIEDYYET